VPGLVADPQGDTASQIALRLDEVLADERIAATVETFRELAVDPAVYRRAVDLVEQAAD